MGPVPGDDPRESLSGSKPRSELVQSLCSETCRPMSWPSGCLLVRVTSPVARDCHGTCARAAGVPWVRGERWPGTTIWWKPRSEGLGCPKRFTTAMNGDRRPTSGSWQPAMDLSLVSGAADQVKSFARLLDTSDSGVLIDLVCRDRDRGEFNPSLASPVSRSHGSDRGSTISMCAACERGAVWPERSEGSAVRPPLPKQFLEPGLHAGAAAWALAPTRECPEPSDCPPR